MSERIPLHRRRWFFRTVFVAVNILVLALIGAYLVHRHFTVLAAAFDLDDLGRMDSASTIYDRRNQTFGHIYLQNRDPVTLAEIPENMIKAVIAAEDVRFYEHGGIDYKGIIRAGWQNLIHGKVRQGASTITQQLARNTYGLLEKKFTRKATEIYLSWRIEKQLTKQKILELYLNRIYLGSGLYGVEAASRGYFGKNAKDLTLAECATLAGLVPSPNNRNPWRNAVTAKNSRDGVLRRMLESGVVSQAQFDQARAEELAVKPRTFATTDSYALEAVRQQVMNLVGFDKATSEGLRIFTTLDSDVQRVAETSLKRKLDEIERHKDFGKHQTHAQYSATWKEAERKLQQQMAANPKTPPVPVSTLLASPEYLQGSLITIDNADGGIIALIGGREFKHSEYNRATSSRRQLGTAFTPLVYAAAYERGIFPGTLVQDALMDNRMVMVGGLTGILGEWGVERASNSYEGLIPATFALVKSKNGATVRFGNEAGLENVLAFAKKAGIKSDLRAYPATFLGQSEITLQELSLAYTMFPNAGWKPQGAYLIKRIEDRTGRLLYEAKPGSRQRVTDENTAYQVHNALSESLKWGTAADAVRRFGLKKFPAGAKAGTSYRSTDVSAIGYTSSVTCAVWAGFDKPQEIYRGAFGSELMLPVWADVMNSAAESMKAVEIPKPPALKRVEICYSSGQLASDRCSEISESTVGSPRRRTTYWEYATPSQIPKQICLVHTGGSRPLAQQVERAQRIDPGAVKAQRVVDLDAILPVMVTASAVLDQEDPYNAVRPPNDPTVPVVAVPVAAATGPVKPGQSAGMTEIRRAKSVLPLDNDPGLPTEKIEPPAAIEFN